MKKEEELMEMNGMGWKVALSIICGVGWLVFLIIWLFFYASNYTFYQNIGIFIMSIFVVMILLGIPWMMYGLRFQTDEEKVMWMTKGFKGRVFVSGIIAFLFIFFLSLWFFLYADNYCIYQNIAVFLVSILIIGGIMGVSWGPWAMRQDKWR